MPRNGSGTYTLPQPAFVPSTTISSTAMNSDLSDIALALTGSMASDGQTAFTGSFKVNDGSAASPSYTFTAAQNTGIFRDSNGINFAIGGATILTVTTSGISGPGGTSLIPVGAVNDFAGTTAPTGWHFCDGSAVSRATYAALFTVIGTTWGAGDGVSTFNLPDLRGRLVAGRDDMGGSAAGRITNAGSGITGTTVGANGGSETVTLSTGQIPSHSHSITDVQHTHTATPNISSWIQSAGSAFTGSGLGGAAAALTVAISNAFTGITGTNTAGGGSSHQNMPPTIIINKIIYAGV